jgi:hypothetical protein
MKPWQVLFVVVVAGVVGWFSACKSPQQIKDATRQAESPAPSPDEKDWRQASSLNTADSYVSYLVEHPDGKFVIQARVAAKNFASVKYDEIQGTGEIVFTSGFKGITSLDLSGEKPKQEYVVKYIGRDGVEYDYAKDDFEFRIGNLILRPRGRHAKLFFYDDKKKGAKFHGFDVLMQGKSQVALIYQAPTKSAVSP